MKTKIQNLWKPSLLAATVATLFLTASAYAVDPIADLTFTGGEGSPLSVTLNLPLSFLITTAGDASPVLIFQGVGNLFGQGGIDVTGDITFSINGGDPQNLDSAGSGFPDGAFHANDLYFYGNLSSLAVNNTVVISAGTLTTTGDFGELAPASGLYSAILADAASSNQISDGLEPVPEPATWATAGLIAVTLLWTGRHRFINLRNKKVPSMTQTPDVI